MLSEWNVLETVKDIGLKWEQAHDNKLMTSLDALLKYFEVAIPG